MAALTCGKCRAAAPEQMCAQCEVLYCGPCAEKRHRKGAFKRHTLTPMPVCDECDTALAVLACAACELNFCDACSTETHSVGSMRDHESSGQFTRLGVFKTSKATLAAPATTAATVPAPAPALPPPLPAATAPLAAAVSVADAAGAGGGMGAPSAGAAAVAVGVAGMDVPPAVPAMPVGLPMAPPPGVGAVGPPGVGAVGPPGAVGSDVRRSKDDSHMPPRAGAGAAVPSTSMGLGPMNGADWEAALGGTLARAIDAPAPLDNPKYRTWSGWDLFRGDGAPPVAAPAATTRETRDMRGGRWSQHLQLVGGSAAPPLKYQTINHLPSMAGTPAPPPGFGDYPATGAGMMSPTAAPSYSEMAYGHAGSASLSMPASSPPTAYRVSSSATRGGAARLSTLQEQMRRAEMDSRRPGMAGGYSRDESRDTRSKPPARTGRSARQTPLDVERVAAGLDKRTTLMVRNIPNKYTQQMLLAEINETHRGLYDFFYLPIDFTNRCNVGYAFINMINYEDIVSLFHKYNGRKWRRFNSEKICVLSYGRIQGKESLITRFQNSSLLDKEEACRPLLFHSDGPLKGQPLEFKPRSRSSRSRGSGRSGRSSKSSSRRSSGRGRRSGGGRRDRDREGHASGAGGAGAGSGDGHRPASAAKPASSVAVAASGGGSTTPA